MLGTGERLKTPSQDYRLLSNLFGAAEFEYMADRFRNPEIRALFTTPGSELRDPHKFETNFRALYPKGKPGSWMRSQPSADDAAGETAIAMGILAKLCGNAYKPTADGKRRRAYLLKLAKLDESEWEPMKGELTAYQKASLMLPILRRKFSPPGPFRRTLESTKDALLVERPMRGKPRLWEGNLRDGTVVGGNLCGRLLMYVRDTLDQPNVSEEEDRRVLTQMAAEAEAASGEAQAETRRSPSSRKPAPANRTRRKERASSPKKDETGAEPTADGALKATPKTKTTRSRKSSKSPAPSRTRRKERAIAKVNAFLAEVRAAEKARASEVDIGKMKVVELRAALKARGLATKGLKKELVERLETALSKKSA